MKRILLTLFAAAAFTLSLPATPVAKSSMPKLMESIKGLQWVDVDNGIPRLGTHCSVSLINAQLHYWLTAVHCIAGENDGHSEPGIAERAFYIDGKEAKVIATDFPHDLAIMQTETSSGRALKFSPTAPEYLDLVLMAGYPYGLGPTISIGYVMRPVMEIRSTLYLALSIAGCPGNSGSPIVNAKGEVISVLQVGVGASQGGCAGLMGGAPYATFRAFARPYFGK